MKKRNKIFAIIGACFMLALSCISFIVPKYVKSAGAYVNQSMSDTISRTEVDLSTSVYDDYFIYSGILSHTLSISGSTKTINITTDFTTSNISNDFNSVSVTPSSFFDYDTYIKDYYDTYATICTQDKLKSVYLSFYYFGTQNALATSSKITVIYNGVSYIIPLSASEYNYNTHYVRYVDDNASSNTGNVGISFMLDLVYLANTYNCSLYELLFNGSFIYEFTSSSDVSTTPLILYGLSFSQYKSVNMLNLLKSNMWGVTPSQYHNVSDLAVFYYMFEGNSLNDYWQNYYKDFYNTQYLNNKDAFYNNGYNAGYAEGAESASILPGAIMSFATLPFSILSGFLNFDLFGFNLYTLILSLCTLLLCIWLIKKIKA